MLLDYCLLARDVEQFRSTRAEASNVSRPKRVGRLIGGSADITHLPPASQTPSPCLILALATRIFKSSQGCKLKELLTYQPPARCLTKDHCLRLGGSSPLAGNRDVRNDGRLGVARFMSPVMGVGAER